MVSKMILSKVIEYLEKEKEKHGDIELCIGNCCGTSPLEESEISIEDDIKDPNKKILMIDVC